MSALRNLYSVARVRLLQNPERLRLLARTIHGIWRSLSTGHKKGAGSSLYQMAERITQDLQKRKIPPDCEAIKHILAVFRDTGNLDKGHEFWSWLDAQDAQYVDASVVGVAIELLALRDHPLDELEAMYERALKRFGGPFAEYHLSPIAVLPDRTKPVDIRGLPMTLLQGIVFARIRGGDWRGAYLGLDAALRLYPTQLPHRFFENFTYSRPLDEAFKVFMLACRAGIRMPGSSLTYLLDRLVKNQMKRNNRALFSDRIALTQNMLNLLQAHAKIGGSVNERHATNLVKAFTSLLPTQSFSNLSDQRDYAGVGLVDKITDMVKTLTASFITRGNSSALGLLNSLILYSARAGRPALMDAALLDMQQLNLQADTATYRSLMYAYAENKNTQGIASTWQALITQSVLNREAL